MKAFILAAALSVAAFPAMAQSVGVSSGSSSGAMSNSGVNFEGSKNTPSAYAPGGIAGANSCMFTLGLGFGVPGSAGSIGIPIEDGQCNARLNAVTAAQVTGDRTAAKEMLCDVRKMRNAFKRAGSPCINDVKHEIASGKRSARPAKVVKTFSSIAACKKYAAKHPGVQCRAR